MKNTGRRCVLLFFLLSNADSSCWDWFRFSAIFLRGQKLDSVFLKVVDLPFQVNTLLKQRVQRVESLHWSFIYVSLTHTHPFLVSHFSCLSQVNSLISSLHPFLISYSIHTACFAAPALRHCFYYMIYRPPLLLSTLPAPPRSSTPLPARPTRRMSKLPLLGRRHAAWWWWSRFAVYSAQMKGVGDGIVCGLEFAL